MNYENIPNDPAMLLSFINMQLRDNYSSLNELCKAQNILKNDIIEKLSSIDYLYDEKTNQFI